jgi:hypothetical protein
MRPAFASAEPSVWLLSNSDKCNFHGHVSSVVHSVRAVLAAGASHWTDGFMCAASFSFSFDISKMSLSGTRSWGIRTVQGRV